MAFNPRLKPFVINATDISFLIDQVDFRPLFDASGNIIVAWDGTGPVYDFNGVQYADQGSAQANLAKWGQSYQNFTDLSGTRDVSGYWNNLTPVLAHYGDTGQIFPRMVTADYSGYLVQVTGDATTGPILVTTVDPAVTTADTNIQQLSDSGVYVYKDSSVPAGVTKTLHEIITTGTTVETAIAKTLSTVVIDGHHLVPTETTTITDSTATTTRYDYLKDQLITTLTTAYGTTQTTGTSIVPTSGKQVTVDTVSGQTVTTLSGAELDGRYHSFKTAYALAHQDYTVQAAQFGPNEAPLEGNTVASDGRAINLKNVIDYTPRMISRTTTTAGVTYDTWANHQFLADGTTPNQDAAHHTVNEIYYDPLTGDAKVLDWGVLETVKNGGEGQVDTQARLAASAGQDDHFIGGLNPGVSPSNGFFVLFGQFFDHGLDFIDKGQLNGTGGNVTIKIALGVDDPLYGMLGADGRPVTEITINRSTVQTLDAKGSEYTNHVSPFIDQSQTYGSDEQRTNLLREWVSTDGGSSFHAGMNLLDGHTLQTQWAKPDGTLTNDTLPTLNELRAHIDATGRDALTWDDIGNLRNRDAAGHVVAGTSGESILLDMNPRFDTVHLLQAQGETSAETQKVLAAITYLSAHGIRPGDTFGFNADDVLTLHLGSDMNMGPGQPALPAGTNLTGASALAGWVNFADFSIMSGLVEGVRSAVSDILLASVGDHYIAGDGRANENFGLTSIHHVFHEEHNFQVQNLIDALHRQDIATNDVTHAKLHEFQIDTGSTNAAGDFIRSDGSIAWNEDKVFLGAKLIVEMEYQHAAVDQYARNVSPNIQEFVGYSPDKQPDVTLEYSQVAFRFGHSTLRETIDTIDPTGGITGKIMGYALHDAFLNPEKFGDVGPGSIVLGMTHQQQNEVDEFVTPALNQGLLGQPLDLAAINIARGRDVGMPTLNDFREALGMVRYTSWNDFGQNMQHPSSLVNFIAAYAFDGAVDKAQAVMDLATHAFADDTAGGVLGSILGWSGTVSDMVSRAYAFLSGDVTHGGAGTLAFNQIDTWLGGLAEVHQPGGLLGETFDKVFVTQIESLMDGDRFYYLYRLAGQQFGEEVANGQLKDIVERNTGLTHLNGNIFGYADQYVDLGAQKEVVASGVEAQTTMNEHKYGDIAAVANGTLGIYSNGGMSNVHDGQLITIDSKTYIQDTRLSADNPMSAEYHGGDNVYALNAYANLDGTPNSGAESSEVIVGSKGDDLIYAQGGDDTVYGDDGNDIIYGGYGIDRLYGGAGSDTLYGGDNPDLIDGGSGDDFLYGESSGSDINGSDQLIGGAGNDLLDGGTGIDKLSAGSGDDRVYGGQDTDPFTHGGDGNDYVDGGSGGDILYGDNGDDIVVGGADQDQLFGGDGDDILRPGDPTGALTIGSDEVLGGDGVDVNDKGFDLIDFSDNNARPGGVTFDIGNQANPNVTVNGSPVQVPSFQIDGVIGSVSDDKLTGSDATDAGNGADASIAGQNWLIGGSGNDILQGLGGNDILVGGSIRLDALIGKYNSGYDHNNNNPGLTDDQQMQDALYQGASHRVLYSETIDDSGLLGHAQTAMFTKHFTEMLRTKMFKDTVLGDDATNTHKGVDTAVYTGNLAQYTLTALDAVGNVVANPHANWSSVLAVKITDNRTGADFTDANGNPLVDANGNPLTSEGTDLLIGIDKLKFADQTISPAAYFDIAPTLDLHYVAQVQNSTVATDTFAFPVLGANSYGSGNSWAGNWTEFNDPATGNAYSTGQIQVAGTGFLNTNPALRFGAGDGASIQRAVDLSGKANATISFNVNETNFGTGETVTVSFAADGTTFVPVKVFDGATNASFNTTAYSFTVSALAGGFSANALLKFEVGAVATVGGTGAHTLTVDNVRVTTAVVADQFPGNAYSTGYTEQLTPAAIASTPLITDPDDTTIASATAVLKDAVLGDILRAGTMPPGIAATVSADGHTVTLNGVASHVDYQTALAAITFSNPSNDNPTNAARHIDVTVNDGFKDSNVATTTVAVTPVNDPTVTGADHIVTNATTFVVPDTVLLANDVDPDSPLSISGASPASGLSTVSHANATQTVGVTTDNATPGGTFNYFVNGVTGAVDVVRQVGSTVNGTAANEILIGTTGNDTLNGGGGNDTIVWNATGSVTVGGGRNPITTVFVTTDGHDVVDGGAGTDTFVLNSTVSGNNTAANGNAAVSEAFGVYTLAEAQIARLTGLHNLAGEIVITRNGVVAAELVNVEEIVINTGAGTDTVTIHGNFSPTSLAYSTIHINDADGGDTVDISALTSNHRIVFDTNATGHVVGDLRPQDVVLQHGTASDSAPAGAVPGAGTGTTGEQEDTGTGTTVDAGAGTGSTPDGGNFGTVDGASDGTHAGDALLGTPDADLLIGHGDAATIMGQGGDDLILGTAGADVIQAGAGDDLVRGGDGNDLIFGGAGNDDLFGGAGKDVIAGDAGDDRIFGDAGNDTLEGGAGHDVISAGSGDDRILATVGDGDDLYFGEAGSDTIDYSAIADTITVDLGHGVDHHGSVFSAGSGSDTIFGFENVITGAGDDTIVANDEINVLDGGGGHNSYVFRSSADANGDTIKNFHPGDVIDLSGIDADASTEGQQSFVLFAGTNFTAAGQVIVTHETLAGHEQTLVQGNTTGGTAADFKIMLDGNHALTAESFHTVH